MKLRCIIGTSNSGDKSLFRRLKNSRPIEVSLPWLSNTISKFERMICHALIT